MCAKFLGVDMNDYVQVSSDLYNMFKKAAQDGIDCEISFLKEKEKITVNSKIVKIKNVSNSEFMEILDGTIIRLDKIIEFNGKPTADVNHYQQI